MNNTLKIIYIFIIIFNSGLLCQDKSETFKDVEIIIKKAIDDKAFPGTVILIWKDGKILYVVILQNHEDV